MDTLNPENSDPTDPETEAERQSRLAREAWGIERARFDRRHRREALSRFVTNGRLEIDKNIAENAMRCIPPGRKNYLFAGSDSGGERAASIYTLVRTAKLNGVNPETYLRDVLEKIAEGHTINRIRELMSWQRTEVARDAGPT
jgi:hypothetical protein